MPKAARKSPLLIRELTQEKELQAIYPLIKLLNPGLTRPVFTKRLRLMRKQGYRCIAAEEGGNLVGACGFWTGTRFWCGTYIEPDNLVVSNTCRSKGIGKKLIAWLETEAKRLQADMIWLLSYTHNLESHRFYLRERYNLRGFVFTKDL